MNTVVCMRWGTRYPAPYVNRLYAGIARHARAPFRLVCFTDDAAGLRAEVEARPLPPIPLPDRAAWSPWRKLSVWQDGLGLEGDVLFLDLDLLVTGPIDDFFAYAPGAYCVIENFTQKGRGIGNPSCFRFPAGRYAEVFEVLLRHRDVVSRVTFWGVTDGDSWRNGWPVEGRTNHPLLFDRAGRPKPAFEAVVRVATGGR